MKGVGINGTRRALVDVLKRFGADISISNEREICNEPVADLRVRGGLGPADVQSNMIDGEMIGKLIDEIPILAIFGTQIDGGLEFRNAGELRVKESDRIAAVVSGLRRMRAEVEELADGLVVRRSTLKGANIDSFGDHRIAMSFAVAALLAEGPSEIGGAECCDVSFPRFFEEVEASATSRAEAEHADS